MARFKTEYKRIALLLVLAAGMTFAVVIWVIERQNIEDDGSLATKAVQVVSGDKQSLFRVTETPFRMSPSTATLCKIDPTGSPPHTGYYCHVFVNENARETIESGSGKYPIGSLIIKQKYNSQFVRSTELFTIMRKMKDGYDDENGNWEYSVVDSTAEQLLLQGREKSCIACHTLCKNTDYVSRAYLKP